MFMKDLSTTITLLTTENNKYIKNSKINRMERELK